MQRQGSDKSALEKIDAAVEHFLSELEGQKVALSATDVLRLLELRKQLASAEIREVRARWVESDPALFVINT